MSRYLPLLLLCLLFQVLPFCHLLQYVSNLGVQSFLAVLYLPCVRVLILCLQPKGTEPSWCHQASSSRSIYLQKPSCVQVQGFVLWYIAGRMSDPVESLEYNTGRVRVVQSGYKVVQKCFTWFRFAMAVVGSSFFYGVVEGCP